MTFLDSCANIISWALQHGGSDSNAMQQLFLLGGKGIFRNTDYEKIYELIAWYSRRTSGDILGSEELNGLLETATLEAEAKEEYRSTFNDLLNHRVKQRASQYYLDCLLELYKKHAFNEVSGWAKKAMVTTVKQGSREFKGYDGAREIILSGVYNIDQISTPAVTDGNVVAEGRSVIDEYAALCNGAPTVKTGFTKIDDCTGGMYPGEMWLWAGFAGDGKTFSCLNIGYNVAFVQKMNVLFLTSETVRPVVKRRLISRHSREIHGQGINLTDYKKGSLDKESYDLLVKTAEDLESNKNNYGIFDLVQLPAGATTDYLAAILAQKQSSFNVDLCILDSIHLLKAKTQRSYNYAELEDMVKEVKNIIVSHNSGKGVPLLSPWHTNRESWGKAKSEGSYTKASLAKTAEAERQSDVIVSIIKEDGSDQLRGSIIKSRDGEELSEFYLAYDFSQGYVGNAPNLSLVTADELFQL